MWKNIFFLIPFLTYGQINVGPAINNLNSRVTVLENKDILTQLAIQSLGASWSNSPAFTISYQDITNWNNNAEIGVTNGLATTNYVNNLFSSVIFSRGVNPTISFMSVISNTVYTSTAGISGIVFLTPETYPSKENKLTLHLYKGIGAVTWFQNITWIYGEDPQFPETNKTYVFQFESIDGVNWRGWNEYLY